MTLDELNALPQQAAEDRFYQCLAVERVAKKMASLRPFSSQQALLEQMQLLWDQADEAENLAAFSAHPLIGDITTLLKKYHNTKALCGNEQSAVNEASLKTLKALSQYNKDYFAKFGFIFIVFATGKTANEMLDLLCKRLDNTRLQEIQNAHDEQTQITLLRLRNISL